MYIQLKIKKKNIHARQITNRAEWLLMHQTLVVLYI